MKKGIISVVKKIKGSKIDYHLDKIFGNGETVITNSEHCDGGFVKYHNPEHGLMAIAIPIEGSSVWYRLYTNLQRRKEFSNFKKDNMETLSFYNMMSNGDWKTVRVSDKGIEYIQVYNQSDELIAVSVFDTVSNKWKVFVAKKEEEIQADSWNTPEVIKGKKFEVVYNNFQQHDNRKVHVCAVDDMKNPKNFVAMVGDVERVYFNVLVVCDRTKDNLDNPSCTFLKLSIVVPCLNLMGLDYKYMSNLAAKDSEWLKFNTPSDEIKECLQRCVVKAREKLGQPGYNLDTCE
jgi:hypothetical protein